MSDTKFADVPDDVLKREDRPDMAHVKLAKAQPGLREGEVLYVDINSARTLVGRGDAQWFDPAEGEGASAAIPRSAGRANVQTMTVKGSNTLTADALVRAAAEGQSAAEVAETTEVVESGAGAGTTVEVTRPTSSSNKSEIVAYAEGKLTHDDGTALTTAELEAKSKRELVDELHLDQ